MNKRSWYQDPEMLVALSAVAISLVALAVGMYEAQLERKFQAASVWPRLEVMKSYNGERFNYQVNNNGMGPAIVKYVTVEKDGVFYKNWRQMLTQVLNLDEKLGFRWGNSQLNGRVIPAGKEVKPLFIYDNIAQKFEQSGRPTVSVCYCSVYEDCWLVTNGGQPREVKQCTIPEKNVFEE